MESRLSTLFPPHLFSSLVLQLGVCEIAAKLASVRVAPPYAVKLSVMRILENKDCESRLAVTLRSLCLVPRESGNQTFITLRCNSSPDL